MRKGLVKIIDFANLQPETLNHREIFSVILNVPGGLISFNHGTLLMGSMIVYCIYEKFW